MKFLPLALLLLATPALAQVGPPQQMTPSQVAIQVNTIIGQWAQTIEAQQRQIQEMSAENARLKAELDALKKGPAK